MSADDPLRRRLLLLSVLAPVLVFLALALWGVSSPVGSSPDDDFHLPSIWCGLGERAGLCEASGNPETRLVPAPLVGEPCYARDPSESAACWNADLPGLIETDRVNVAPLYPPVFYAAMSVFASPDVVASVIAMRLFNAALFTGLVTATALALPSALRRPAILPFIVTMVPLGLFIVPSTNASSWAVLSAGVLWIALYGAAYTGGRRRWVLLALAMLAGLIGAGARADAAAFAVLAIVVVVLLTARRDAQLLPVLVVAVSVVAMSAAFYLSSAQSSAVTAGLPTNGSPLTNSQLVENFLGVPSLWIGMFGGWGLGWLDTPMPAAVSVLGFAVMAMTAAVGLLVLRRRQAIAVAMLFAALWLVPFVLLWQSRAVIGTHVQPRYILPIAILLVGVALLSGGPRDDRPLPRAVVITGAGLLAFTNAVALHVQISRYTSGLDDRPAVPGADAEWWWTGGLPAWAVWVGGTLAFAVALVTLLVYSSTQARSLAAEQSADAPASAGG